MYFIVFFTGTFAFILGTVARVVKGRILVTKYSVLYWQSAKPCIVITQENHHRAANLLGEERNRFQSFLSQPSDVLVLFLPTWSIYRNVLGSEKPASQSGETHASVRGVEWLRQGSKVRDEWFHVLWSWELGDNLSPIRRNHSDGTWCLPLSTSKPNHFWLWLQSPAMFPCHSLQSCCVPWQENP